MQSTYRGTTKTGRATTGYTSVAPVDFARSAFDRGWLELTMARNGTTVGGITTNDDGELIWWGDSK